MKINKKKIGVTASGVTVLTAGTILAVSAYQSDQNFDPSGAGDIQNNQVVFSDENDSAANDRNNKKDQSHSISDSQTDSQKKTQLDAGSDYLFENGQIAQNIAIANPLNPSADYIQNGTGQNPGTIYDVSGSGSGSNTIISGGSGSGDNTSGGQNGSGSSSGNGSGNGSGNNGGNGGNNSGTNTRPTSAIKDPSIEKEKPGYDPGNMDTPFKEDTKPSGATDADVIISQPWTIGDNVMYKGQEIDGYKIFCMLDTYVREKLSDGVYNRHYWTKEHYGEDGYIKVDSVSFDGGTTWVSDFPVTIPNDVSDEMIFIKVSYRLSLDAAWTERQVAYMVKDNCVYVLSGQLSEDEEEIPTDKILYKSDGDPTTGLLNLFRQQESLMGYGRQDKLFPGWMEDGKMVSWLYPATSGRHILEAADYVPLSDDYTVQLNLYWMNNDYEVDNSGSNLSYLQTLTAFSDKAEVGRRSGGFWDRFRYSEVDVPKYVQAVVIDDDQQLNVDYLKLPDTVIYIKNTGTGLTVNQGYEVDADNPMYQSTDEGVLMNKSGTAIEGIPYEAESLTVPATVEKVMLDKKNKIGSVYLKAETEDQIPDINFDNMKNCKIIADQDIIETVAARNYRQFAPGTSNTIATTEDEDTAYTIQNGIMVSADGDAYKALPIGYTTVRMPETVKKIQKEAFADAADVRTILMPADGGKVTLDKNSLAGSHVKKIMCYSQTQYDQVKKQLKNSGASSDTEVQLLGRSDEGYQYTTDSEGNCLLLDVPKDITEFDGTVTVDGKELTISEIADNAFEECEDLTWVSLPESVKRIGTQAFEGCTSLQGVIILSEDKITIGNDAFAGCDSLRFAASNALTAEMEQGYDPLITDSHRNDLNNLNYFFIRLGAEGYGENTFTADGIIKYKMIDVGAGKMLYGTDEKGAPVWGLRCGTTVSEKLVLPKTTTCLARYALCDTTGPDGTTFTVNWSDLTALDVVGDGCFEKSTVQGDLKFTDCKIGEKAFSDCENITSVEIYGDKTDLGGYLFRNCTKLKSVYFDVLVTELEQGSFDGCDSLTDITFTENTLPPSLIVNYGLDFRFNNDWTMEEEMQKLHLHIPEGCEWAFIRGWRYLLTGYTYSTYKTDYQNLWDGVQWELYRETYIMPDDEVVDAEVERKVLESENRVRAMTGQTLVKDPSHYYPYRVDANGFLTLVGASADSTDVRLDNDTLELPEGWFLDYVGTGAFRKCKNLHSVTAESTLVGIKTNAFKGVESNMTLNVECTDPTALPVLVLDASGTPFEFGVSDDQLHINVPEGMEEAYINAWKYPLCGYADAWDMYFSGLDEAEQEQMLLEAENRLRRIMGLDEIKPAETKENPEEASEAKSEDGDTGKGSKDAETEIEPDQNKEQDSNSNTSSTEEKESGTDDKTDGTGKDTEE